MKIVEELPKILDTSWRIRLNNRIQDEYKLEDQTATANMAYVGTPDAPPEGSVTPNVVE
ncbi:MAG: hypothetical protein Q9180_000207 [Flavoplaca navasiana]